MKISPCWQPRVLQTWRGFRSMQSGSFLNLMKVLTIMNYIFAIHFNKLLNTTKVSVRDSFQNVTSVLFNIPKSRFRMYKIIFYTREYLEIFRSHTFALFSDAF